MPQAVPLRESPSGTAQLAPAVQQPPAPLDREPYPFISLSPPPPSLQTAFERGSSGTARTLSIWHVCPIAMGSRSVHEAEKPSCSGKHFVRTLAIRRLNSPKALLAQTLFQCRRARRMLRSAAWYTSTSFLSIARKVWLNSKARSTEARMRDGHRDLEILDPTRSGTIVCRSCAASIPFTDKKCGFTLGVCARKVRLSAVPEENTWGGTEDRCCVFRNAVEQAMC